MGRVRSVTGGKPPRPPRSDPLPPDPRRPDTACGGRRRDVHPHAGAIAAVLASTTHRCSAVYCPLWNLLLRTLSSRAGRRARSDPASPRGSPTPVRRGGAPGRRPSTAVSLASEPSTPTTPPTILRRRVARMTGRSDFSGLVRSLLVALGCADCRALPSACRCPASDPGESPRGVVGCRHPAAAPARLCAGRRAGASAARQSPPALGRTARRLGGRCAVEVNRLFSDLS